MDRMAFIQQDTIQLFTLEDQSQIVEEEGNYIFKKGNLF